MATFNRVTTSVQRFDETRLKNLRVTKLSKRFAALVQLQNQCRGLKR